MKPLATDFEGLFLIEGRKQKDERGSFTKFYNSTIFSDANLQFELHEQYVSSSNKGVIRGMHFQLPPMQHKKIVYCLRGEVLDVVLDLRRNSGSFGKFAAFLLSEDSSTALFIPEGFAHGFLATTDNALMIYNVSSVYSPENDSGILWNSIGFDWPVSEPTISNRDRSFTEFEKFRSPF